MLVDLKGELISLCVIAVLVATRAEVLSNELDEESNFIEKAADLLVTLPNGRILGKDNGFYYSWTSIPYAEPPVGELRFESPRLYVQKWNDTWDATKPAIKCLQWNEFKEGPNKLEGEEDCLTMSIYKPKNSTITKFPVIVLIHGGSFMHGATNKGHEIVMRNGRAIVARMAYRVGPLGFLSTEDTGIPGNFGLKDQHLALQWIKNNIARFGGDPDAIIVVGFSAGGSAAHLHMLRKDFTRYAKGAVSFSGTALNPWVFLRKPRINAIKLAKLMDCPNLEDTLEIKKCLQDRPAEEIVTAVRKFLVFGYNPFSTFGPVVEHSDVKDAFLTRHPEDIIRSGDFSDVPWLTSYTSEDGCYNAGELRKRSADGTELIEELNRRWLELAPQNLFFQHDFENDELRDQHSQALKAEYLGNKSLSAESYLEVQRMYTDVLFKDPAERAIQIQSAQGKGAVYAFVYDNPTEDNIGVLLSKRSDINFGTPHGSDFTLIFPIIRSMDLRPDEQIISQNFLLMLEYFIHNVDGLAYGACRVENNVGKDALHLLVVNRGGCKPKEP